MNCKYTTGNTCNKGFKFSISLCEEVENKEKFNAIFCELFNSYTIEKVAQVKVYQNIIDRLYSCSSNEVNCSFMIPWREDHKNVNPWDIGGVCFFETEKTKEELENDIRKYYQDIEDIQKKIKDSKFKIKNIDCNKNQ